MKRILSFLLTLCLLLALAACDGQDPAPSSSSSTPDAPPATDYSQKTVSMQDALPLSILDGRTGMLPDGAISFDWSGNAITFTADCEGTVSLFLSVGNTGVFSDDAEGAAVAAAFSLTVDGVRTVDRFFVYEEDGLIEWTLAEDLPRGEHTFRIVRQSKIMNATADLYGITLCGELKAMTDDAPYIEFIGDSITCGYGVYRTVEHPDAVGGYLSFLSDNAEEAHAVKTANALGARYSIAGFSGSGYAFGWNAYNVPEMYGKTSFVRGDAAYGFEKKPDLVVIHLGGNDYNRWGILPDGTTLEGEEADTYFREEFVSFFNTLVEKYGYEVPIVFVYASVNINLFDRITAILDEEFSYLPLHSVSLTPNTDGNKGHPSAEGATVQAQELTTFLRTEFPDLFGE